MTKRYVQHISGVGKKWELLGEAPVTLLGWSVEESGLSLYLPKSEYRLCDPPEQWVDVTGECATSSTNDMIHLGCSRY